MKTITVYYKNVYGNELCYPKCETAKKLAKLTNSKTFTHTHLNDIQSLGYEILVGAYNPKDQEGGMSKADKALQKMIDSGDLSIHILRPNTFITEGR
jgi:hypothetical protein|tara:strand:- start:125 stop:415 length:291 start_codon:yes stop_codon:yes gene_type:complete